MKMFTLKYLFETKTLLMRKFTYKCKFNKKKISDILSFGSAFFNLIRSLQDID